MRNARLTVLVAMLAVAAPLATGCGVSLQSEPQALPANVLPAPLPVPPSASPSASSDTSPAASASPVATTSEHLRLWFVVDDGLAAAESTLAVGSPPEAVLEALALGPDLEQETEGLRTIARDPLTAQPLVSVVEPAAEPEQPAPTATGTVTSAEPTFGPSPAAVTVRVSSAFTALPPAEQVLLLGQVVLSLAGAGERSVSFIDDAGTSLAVPLPDGRLLDVPATARDYSPLIVQP